jgi:hypothetical protein
MKPRKLHVEIQGYQNLKDQLINQWPDLDDETLADTLEGITSLHEMIAEIVRSALDDQALASGLKTRIDAMKERLERLQARAAKKRELALTAMLEADIGKLTQPDFTVSTRSGSPALKVQDEARIPEQFWIPQAPKLDRQGLLHALKAGRPIEGAVLSNPEPSLTVRTK